MWHFCCLPPRSGSLLTSAVSKREGEGGRREKREKGQKGKERKVLVCTGLQCVCIASSNSLGGGSNARLQRTEHCSLHVNHAEQVQNTYYRYDLGLNRAYRIVIGHLALRSNFMSS